MPRDEESLRPTRRRVLLAGAAAASGCAVDASSAAPVDRPSPNDALDATTALQDVAQAADAGAADAPDIILRDRVSPADVPTDLSREDRGAPCGIETPFAASVSLAEVPSPGAVIDYDLYVVIARDERGLYAYTAICTHQRCVLVLEEGVGTRCPCHDSTFDPDGARISGPATRALVNHPVRVCEGRVFVDRTHAVSAGTRVPAEG